MSQNDIVGILIVGILIGNFLSKHLLPYLIKLSFSLSLLDPRAAELVAGRRPEKNAA